MVDIVNEDGTPVMNPNKPEEQLSYHINKTIVKYLLGVKELINKRDKDWVVLIDGYEGSGKSTLGQQLGKLVDPTLDLSRICMTADEFKSAIMNAKKGNCVIYDEAVTGLTSGDSVSRIGKLLKSMMMQMRQKNLFVIVILPTVFELNAYAALSRAKFLFHTYEVGGKPGFYVGYNRRLLKPLYLRGKKKREYCVKSHLQGRFFGKYTVDEELYRKKKEQTLFLLDEPEVKTEYRRLIEQRNSFLRKYKERNNLTLKELELEAKEMGVQLSSSQIGLICQGIVAK